MHKIRKLLYGGFSQIFNDLNNPLLNILTGWLYPISNQTLKLKNVNDFSVKSLNSGLWDSILGSVVTPYSSKNILPSNTVTKIPANLVTQTITNNIPENSNIGQGVGAIFSQGVSSAFNKGATNLLKGATFTQGMEEDVGSSIAGAATGYLSEGVGKGINSLGGDSMLSRGFGQGVATGLGTVGGTIASNLLNYGRLSGGASKLFGTGNSIWTTTKTTKDALGNTINSSAGAINPYALGALIAGTGLLAAFGPSKEYEGTYGDITLSMDSLYDSAQAAVGLIPGWGLAAAGAMALNKGLSNIFGSTSGMTKQDAILGSAFMPAPVKWLNMAGAKTTDTFGRLSWLNQLKANAFMGNAFGDLGDRFDLARKESGKTYGTFSRGAYSRALNNLRFANTAWNTVLAMADLNELQRIRSQAMASINNQRYAQNIQGGWQPTYRGKQGMKILNNATNHNIGQRLLSGAALIDNKQMILSALHGNVLLSADEIIQRLGGKPKLKVEVASNDNTWVEPTDAAVKATKQKNSHLDEKVIKGAKDFADNDKKFRKEHPILATVGDAVAVAPMAVVAVPAINAVGDALAATTAGLAATNGLIWLSNAAKATPWFTKTRPWVDAGMTSLFGAHGISETAKGNFTPTTALELSPLIGLANRAIKTVNLGSRWAFNKAGLLVRVPNKNSLKGFNFNDLPQEKYVYNDKTGEFDIVAPKKEWIRKGEELTKEYFGEHLYDELISKGFSPKDAAMVASTRYAGAIDARPGVLRNLGKNTHGESLLLNENTIQPIYNSRKHVPASLNDANTTLETVFHELGGHGSSFNIEYGQPLKINDTYFIRLMKILDHNEKLRPKLRPFYLAVKDGDFKLAETLVPKDGTLKGLTGEIDYKKLQDFIKYMEKNLEYTARAIATNMGEHYGLRKNGFNIKLLRLFFTDESVDNLLKNVWNYGVPITIGGSTAATLYNTNK